MMEAQEGRHNPPPQRNPGYVLGHGLDQLSAVSQSSQGAPEGRTHHQSKRITPSTHSAPDEPFHKRGALGTITNTAPSTRHSYHTATSSAVSFPPGFGAYQAQPHCSTATTSANPFPPFVDAHDPVMSSAGQVHMDPTTADAGHAATSTSMASTSRAHSQPSSSSAATLMAPMLHPSFSQAPFLSQPGPSMDMASASLLISSPDPLSMSAMPYLGFPPFPAQMQHMHPLSQHQQPHHFQPSQQQQQLLAQSHQQFLAQSQPQQQQQQHQLEPQPYLSQSQYLEQAKSRRHSSRSQAHIEKADQASSHQQQPVGRTSSSQHGGASGRSHSQVATASASSVAVQQSHVRSNPQRVPEYADAIMDYLRRQELKFRPMVEYMRKQKDINHSMRSILVDWLVEVAEEYRLHTQTLYITVGFIDRFLSQMGVQRSKLQLVGVTCMLLAAKYEEIYPPTVEEFVFITDHTYNREQVLKMEHVILKVLRFDMGACTALTFVERLLEFVPRTEASRCMTLYIAELSLLLGERFMKYYPSVIAAASVCLAQHCFDLPVWTLPLAYEVQRTPEEVQACAHELYEALKAMPLHPQQSIRHKYGTQKFQRVSQLPAPLDGPDIVAAARDLREASASSQGQQAQQSRSGTEI
eukprot:m.68439 g.68439  ORF g.68439 m.68439 type:complete len:638 (-) comp12198_c0_seq1:462-2375(-)